MKKLFKGFLLSDSKRRIDLDVVCRLLQVSSYWANKRSRETIAKSLKSSLCFGVYAKSGEQIAFARAVTDLSTTFWLCDVIVDEKYRGQGIGTALVDFALSSPKLKDLNGVLATKDAHELYKKFGFATLDHLFMGRLGKPS